jgi:hypothetical protein
LIAEGRGTVGIAVLLRVRRDSGNGRGARAVPKARRRYPSLMRIKFIVFNKQ